MTATVAKRAAAHLATIRANVDDYYADRITYAEFGERQTKAWASVKADGAKVDAEVLRLMRETQAPMVSA